jgi:hypothetical protein
MGLNNAHSGDASTADHPNVKYVVSLGTALSLCVIIPSVVALQGGFHGSIVAPCCDGVILDSPENIRLEYIFLLLTSIPVYDDLKSMTKKVF